MVKGYSQKRGVDFDEVFAPVVRFESIRVLIAIAAQSDWTLHHLDVKSAFLNGEVEEKLYVKQPEGFTVQGKENHILRLKKALYGLKQAPRAWYFKLHNCLLNLGFTKSQHEQAVYLKWSSEGRLIVGVYVDDLIITGSRMCDVDDFKRQMKAQFEMSDLGLLTTYLGIEIKQRPDSICLSQSGYARRLLEIRGLVNCNPSSTPLEAQIKFSKEDELSRVNSTDFRSVIGSLWYLTHTRPNLIFSVGLLSRYMENPSSEHLSSAKRILRYVKGTIDYGLVYMRH